MDRLWNQQPKTLVEAHMSSPSMLPTSLPAGFAAQREALHRLATYVVAPARHRATERFGLRWHPGGFATPPFPGTSGEDSQIRVNGTTLEFQQGWEVSTAAVTTLQAAADFLGGPVDAETAAEHDSPPVGDPDADLGVTADVVSFLDQWWGLGTAALEVVRADDTSVDPSEVQLWPGHFDTAIEVGDEDRRASFGASPGDHNTPEPYLYVSAWWPDRLDIASDNPFWNADGYTGALLPVSELLGVEDPLTTAVAFFRKGRDELIAS